MKYFVGVCFIFLSALSLAGQSRFSKWNFSYQYDLSGEIRCQHKTLNKSDSISIFLCITIDKNSLLYKNVARKDVWFFDYRITESYENKESILTGSVGCRRLVKADSKYLFNFNIPKPSATSGYLFIAYLENEEGKIFIEDIPLKILDRELSPENCLFEPDGISPLFENYILKKDSVIVRQGKGKGAFNLQYFKYNFAQAMPPMLGPTVPDADVKITPDSILYLQTNTIIPIFKKGNYVAKPLNSSYQGTNFLVVENRFPKVSKTRELIDPVIYIASDDERKGMRNSKKPKVKLDDFWLSLGQDKDFARTMIKNYYRKVEEANILFTNHKEGWKTDQGIIYIVFGQPDQVFKQDLKETWKYKKRPNVPAINFVFNKKINPFGDYYFELESSPDYMDVWFNTAELWRKGILDK